jgi:hypothetical protein
MGEAEQKKKCGHATSLRSGSGSGVFAIYSWFCTWAIPLLILRTALRGM